MIANREDNARLQSDFYKYKYRKTLRWLIASLIIMFLLIAGIIYLVLFQPLRHYYANTMEGKILEMTVKT